MAEKYLDAPCFFFESLTFPKFFFFQGERENNLSGRCKSSSQDPIQNMCLLLNSMFHNNETASSQTKHIHRDQQESSLAEH